MLDGIRNTDGELRTAYSILAGNLKRDLLGGLSVDKRVILK
jgi:hypothetical protein